MGARPHLIVACALLLAVYLAPAGADEALSPELLTVFRRLDELGRDAVADARLVELRYREVLTSRGARERSKEGWLLDGDDEGLTLLYEDLLPWRYPKGKPVLVPASWHPDLIEVAEVRAADFEAVLVGLAKPLPEPGSQEWMEADHPLPVDKGRRLLAARAAWKKGLSSYAEAVLAADPDYAGSPAAFLKEAMDDVAWYSFLRGVKLFSPTEGAGRRDEQIEELRAWYLENKDRLVWDEEADMLVVEPTGETEQQ